SQRRSEVDGVHLVSFQQAVEVECSTRTRTGFHGNAGAVMVSGGGSSRTPGTASVGTEAGQRDVAIAASLHRDSGYSWSSVGSTAGTAGTRIGRNSVLRHRIRPAAAAVLYCPWSFPGESAPRPISSTDAVAPARSA